jgi:hypothetical protein
MIHSRIPSLRATAERAFPQTFLDQSAAVEPLQFTIPAHRVCFRFTPEEAQ